MVETVEKIKAVKTVDTVEAPLPHPDPATDYLAPHIVPTPVHLPDTASAPGSGSGAAPDPALPAAVPLPWPPPPGPGLGTLLHAVYGLTRAQWLTALDRLPLVGGFDELAVEPGGGPVLRRPVPSVGALYGVGLHCVLPDGCYRYDPLHHRLLPIRSGDHRAAIGIPPTAEFGWVCTVSVRTIAARYGEFGYRFGCLETGVVTAQCEVVAPSAGLRAARVVPFDPAVAAGLLRLDPLADPVTEVVAFHPAPSAADAAPPAEYPNEPATALRAPEPPRGPVDALLPRTAALLRALHRGPAPDHSTVELPRAHPLDLAHGLARPRSALRGLSRLPVTGVDFATVLSAATTPEDGGFLFCYVNEVTGLPRGLFRYLPGRHRLLPISVGNPGPALADCAVQDFAREGFHDSAAGLIWAADPADGLRTHGADAIRLRYTRVGAAAHRACLAAATHGLAARLHADALPAEVDRLLGVQAELPASTLLLQLGLPAPGTARPEHRLGPATPHPPNPTDDSHSHKPTKHDHDRGHRRNRP
ncbi:hypothetical protein ACH4VR_03570 [Streptomyces sp. NPDC020883]|uniref:hypothetical protein n=1 Tax=Streptomyces sp. NPDC020883 TaxID=3365099 RepID=UPI0037AC4EFE